MAQGTSSLAASRRTVSYDFSDVRAVITGGASGIGFAVAHAHYAASKAGVIALARSLASELGPNVRVNAFSPGTKKTPMVNDLL